VTPVAKPTIETREHGDSRDGTNHRGLPQKLLGLEELLRLDGAKFVDRAYHTLLLRQPDEGGRRFYLARLLNGTQKIQILSEIVSSKEARDLAVTPPTVAAAIRWYRLSKTPIFGPIIRFFANIQANSVLAMTKRKTSHSITDPAANDERSARLQTLSITGSEIHCLKSLHMTGEAGVFVTHSPDGNIKPHVAHCLTALKRHGISVVLIIAADRPVKNIAPDLMSLVSGLFVRENKACDFAAWAHVLQLYPTLFASPILYLMNDSLFGPLNDVRFASLLVHIRRSVSDVVGMTDRYEHNWHIQYFFLAFKPRALSSVALHRFINAISCCSDREGAIRNYEITFVPHLRERGLKIEVLFECANNVSHDNRFKRTFFNWKELIYAGFPFVKVMALRAASLDNHITDWRQILTKEGYDVSLVDRTLPRTMAHNEVQILTLDDQRTNVAPLVSGPRFISMEPPRVAFIGPWNYDNELGFASRGYLSALWQTEFLVNLHPIRAPFHIHRRMAPTVDVRTFSGDADLVVVHLNPDAWPGLLSEEHHLIMSKARKIVGIWASEATKIPDNWYPIFDTVDAIWVPSRYYADVLGTSSKVPVEVVRHVIAVRSGDTSHSSVQLMRRRMGIVGDERIILFCFDGVGNLVRKNPFGLISGFARSGLAREGWVLVLKTQYLFDSPAQGRRLKEEAERHPGVVLIDRSLDQAMMSELMNIADIYASPHCSERFGMTIAEAMAAGKEVVATDYGGSRDFLDETCGYPVQYRLKTLEEDHGHHTPGRIWADIDELDLAAALKKAAERVMSGDLSIGQAARSRIRSLFSPHAVGRVMQQAAATLLKN
jgi:glycosyltransferase involved in cell wall biosynthesis